MGRYECCNSYGCSAGYCQGVARIKTKYTLSQALECMRDNITMINSAYDNEYIITKILDKDVLVDVTDSDNYIYETELDLLELEAVWYVK